MMQKVFRRILDDIPLRLSVTAVFVTVPLTITTSWLAAAYRQAMGNEDFLSLMARFSLLSFFAAFIAGSVILLPLERWVIRDRAIHSQRWRAIRHLLYIVAGIPVGLAILASLRLGVGQQDTIIESAYIVNAAVFTGAVAIMYTFVEQAAEEVKKRETQLQHQIEELRIEIDEIKRDRQVTEIAGTEYFQDLQAQAEKLKERRQQKHREE
jgi:hypothetical protein